MQKKTNIKIWLFQGFTKKKYGYVQYVFKFPE